MPIVYRPSDIFASGCAAIVNPVNCVGVMGAGLALAFKRRYPSHFASYRESCRTRVLRPGAVHIDDFGELASPRFIVALPTKRHWRDPSRLDDVERSLDALATELRLRRIPSVALPKLGCGLGGLPWPDVHAAIVRSLTSVASDECRVVIVASHPPSAPTA